MRVKVLCMSCRQLLLKYDKRGTGALVKIKPSRIISDATDHTNDCACPRCGQVFAREMMLGCVRFRKLLGGKVYVQGGGIAAR